MGDRRLLNPGKPLRAVVQVPGDKSLSHRALLFAAIAEGESTVTGLGPGADIASTISAIEQLGVTFDEGRVRSPGIAEWSTPEHPIDCGNSGTTMRLLAGLLSTSSVRATLVGDDSLSRRPMQRLVGPLTSLGGEIETSPQGTAPLLVGGVSGPRGASVTLDLASAQTRSAFELAALHVPGSSTIDSPPGFRDHTERWLEAAGRGEWRSATAFTVHAGELLPAPYDVPGDPSSAAFLWAIAASRRGGEILTPTISLNPGRLGFLQILEEMGAEIEAEVTGEVGGDPIGDVIVRGRDLTGVEIGGALVAAALDELPLVAVLGALAEGVTRVSDAAELRVKESDRIASTAAMIRALGGGVETSEDGFSVIGTGFLEGGVVESDHDHRIAMAGAVAAMSADGPVTIRGAEVAAISWPGFYDILDEMFLEKL